MQQETIETIIFALIVTVITCFWLGICYSFGVFDCCVCCRETASRDNDEEAPINSNLPPGVFYTPRRYPKIRWGDDESNLGFDPGLDFDSDIIQGVAYTFRDSSHIAWDEENKISKALEIRKDSIVAFPKLDHEALEIPVDSIVAMSESDHETNTHNENN